MSNLQENTFQAVVITDGSVSFALYIYQCDLIQWSGEGIGSYATVGYNLNGVFENHPLSGTSQINNIDCLSPNTEFSLQEATLWKNEIFQISSTPDPEQDHRAQCIIKQQQDIQTYGDVDAIASSISPCPPSLFQAWLDFRFIFYFPFGTISSTCFIHTFPAGNSAFRCCYSLL